MKRNTRKLLRLVAGLLVPAILVLVAYGLISAMNDIKPLFMVLHLVTVAWAVFFYRTAFTRVTLLPLSFLASLVAPWIMGTVNSSDWFPYFGTALFAVLYALPWALVTLVIATVKVLRGHKKGYTMIPIDPSRGREE